MDVGLAGESGYMIFRKDEWALRRTEGKCESLWPSLDVVLTLSFLCNEKSPSFLWSHYTDEEIKGQRLVKCTSNQQPDLATLSSSRGTPVRKLTPLDATGSFHQDTLQAPAVTCLPLALLAWTRTKRPLWVGCVSLLNRTFSTVGVSDGGWPGLGASRTPDAHWIRSHGSMKKANTFGFLERRNS